MPAGRDSSMGDPLTFAPWGAKPVVAVRASIGLIATAAGGRAAFGAQFGRR